MPFRVLVVDDNLVNRLLVITHLKKAGWEIFELDNGEAVIPWLTEHTIDVVLLNISMPGLSGEEVCRLLRQHPQLRDTRVIAYTAHALADEHDRIMAAGFDEILTKPISKAELFRVLERVLGH